MMRLGKRGGCALLAPVLVIALAGSGFSCQGKRVEAPPPTAGAEPPPTAGAEPPPPPPPPSPPKTKGAGHPSAPTTSAGPRVTARDFLLQGAREESGYGLYSYLLFATRPPDRQGEHYLRYLKAVEAFLTLETAGSAEVYSRRGDINVTFLPVRAPAAGAAELLEQYDYARAARLLAVAGSRASGPLIVSARTPLSGAAALPREHLFQDLSTVPPGIVQLWVRHFIAQAAQERFWERQTRDGFLLGLRTFVARGGEQFSQINAAVASLFWGFAPSR